MSFERVFKQWLIHQDDSQEERMDEDTSQNVTVLDTAGDSAAEEGMPVIQREAWREEEVKDMPVLQRMVDLPDPGGRKLRSPPPPPLQINSHPGDCFTKIDKDQIGCDGDEKNVNIKSNNIFGNKATQDPIIDKNRHQCHLKSALTDLTRLSHGTSPTAPRCLEEDLTESGDHQPQDGKDPHHCAVSKHSPGVLHRKSQVLVLSPEHDAPMEPDSTSEFGAGSVKWPRLKKNSEACRGEVSPQGEVSPRSTGLAGAATPSNISSEVTVRVEESPAECDSTSMFMLSPSAISPASQGDIEERVCSVLTDHEDGASPAHCVCRCRSLPPPTDLVPRDHVPITTTPSLQPPAISTTHLTKITPGTISKKSLSKSWSPLVSHRNSLDDDTAPDLEKVAPRLDPVTEAPVETLQAENSSPPVLTLSEQVARGKQFHTDFSQPKDIPSEDQQHESPPPLVKYGNDTSTKQSDSSDTASLDTVCSDRLPHLSVCEQESTSKLHKTKADTCDFVPKLSTVSKCAEVSDSAKSSSNKQLSEKRDFPKPNKRCEEVLPTHSKKKTEEFNTAKSSKKNGELSVRSSKKQADAEVCDFGKNIDWQSAVAETVESPPDLTNHEGNSKPGIILKIRTKSMAPRPEPAPEPAPVPLPVQRKRHTIDSPEMLSRLRKRQKSGEVEKPQLPASEDKKPPKPADCPAPSKQEKTGSQCNCSNPRNKRCRRNTVQLGDLKAHAAKLCPANNDFVSTAIKLSRLQTGTHELVCTLFPRIQPHLSHMTPESRQFTKIIDDIITELEQCDSGDSERDDLCERLERLSVDGVEQNGLVPVFLPQVTLCSSPEHFLEEFRDRVCTLLQLILPDLPVSLSNSLSETSDELEIVMKRIVMANSNKALAAKKC